MISTKIKMETSATHPQLKALKVSLFLSTQSQMICKISVNQKVEKDQSLKTD